MLYLPPMATSSAEGALEHLNASAYVLSDYPWPVFKLHFLTVFSHEYFHRWNVKRIHSTKLGPFDYTTPVHTSSLWFSEGTTEYYAVTLLARQHMISKYRWYNELQNWMRQSRALTETQKSLEQCSLDEGNTAITAGGAIYSKGALVSLLLDVEIRNRTQNRRSLDDVMRSLQRDAEHGRYFTDADLIHAIEKHSGVGLADFYRKYICGTDSLPLKKYLDEMGVRLPVLSEENWTGGKTVSSIDSVGRVELLDSSTSLWQAGVRVNDQIIEITGKPVSSSALFALSFQASEAIPITVQRGHKRLDLVLPAPPHSAPAPAESPFTTGASELALSIRHSLLDE